MTRHPPRPMPDDAPPDGDDATLHTNPGTDAAPPINPHLRPGAPRPAPPLGDWVEQLRAGDRVALSRAITLAESTRSADQEQARRLLDACLPYAGRSIRVGITGVPGVGKSTFVEALGTLLTQRGRRLAVLTVDPSSARTRGSILGDKTRMPRLAADPNAFIRPSPSAGALGGVARNTRAAMLLCEAAGFDAVFVETVGVGQSETEVDAMVDFFLLLMLAGAGDELQGIKRGIMEMADALVVTKADGANRDAALEARGAYRNALSLYPPPPSGWRPRVLTCSAVTGEGIEAVWETVEAYEAHTRSSGYFEAQRREQARTWMHRTIEDHLHADFFADPAVRAALPGLEQAVSEGRRTATDAARALLDLHQGRPRRER